VVGTLWKFETVSHSEGCDVVPSEGQFVHQATIASQSVKVDKMEEAIQNMDLSQLPQDDQAQVKSLFHAYRSVFSAYEGDLGCTKLITHEIPLLDNDPIRQRYRCLPPSDYEAVNQHIYQLLQSGDQREF